VRNLLETPWDDGTFSQQAFLTNRDHYIIALMDEKTYRGAPP
jgi:hypothetical protein